MARPKNRMLADVYDRMLAAARNPASELWYNGQPRRGASHRQAFWDGYLGLRSPMNIPATLTSACYKAGQQFAKERPGVQNAEFRMDRYQS
jgi:hypothetical protein